MSGLLKDKVAIVTGGGRGMGKAFALEFAKEGQIVLPDINLKGAESVAQEITTKGGKAVAMEADISRQEDTRKMQRRLSSSMAGSISSSIMPPYGMQSIPGPGMPGR